MRSGSCNRGDSSSAITVSGLLRPLLARIGNAMHSTPATGAGSRSPVPPSPSDRGLPNGRDHQGRSRPSPNPSFVRRGPCPRARRPRGSSPASTAQTGHRPRAWIGRVKPGDAQLIWAEGNRGSCNGRSRRTRRRRGPRRWRSWSPGSRYSCASAPCPALPATPCSTLPPAPSATFALGVQVDLVLVP